MKLVVARIGRPHGIHGEVSLDVRTDSPGDRLVSGARLATDRDGIVHLTVSRVRHDTTGWFVRFSEVASREDALALRGAALLVDDDGPPEPDAWYPHQLRGLAVTLPDGSPAGEVCGLVQGPAQDWLEVREPSGVIALVPFVRALVPVVDVAGGRIVVDPPPGLLEVRPSDEGGSEVDRP
ncbi:MAG: ribosome maturation factor RimM [Bifidobacteriaceae bacterium]|nr:ribosome maturation factor RimM [Bifidobacteriaceae bacterium]